MCTAHTDADVARTLQACEDALKVLPRKKTRP
jgi:glutamate-1-semialdehyde aminotransferase